MKLKISTATWSSWAGNYGRASGRWVRRGALHAGGTGRYRLESSPVSDGYPACAQLLVRKARLPGGQLEQAREILRDIESLLPHNESLFQKVNFLMQAAMGFINIEQNRIIKIFSVVSVVFLPPTLVASSYGMNFEFMPELKWSFGYQARLSLWSSRAWHRICTLSGRTGCNMSAG